MHILALIVAFFGLFGLFELTVAGPTVAIDGRTINPNTAVSKNTTLAEEIIGRPLTLAERSIFEQGDQADSCNCLGGNVGGGEFCGWHWPYVMGPCNQNFVSLASS